MAVDPGDLGRRHGHASNLDNPTVFTATLLAFLDRVLPPGDAEQPPSPTERAAELHRR
jgi:hypothetical protein